jgi:hypothetical protein
MHDVIGGAGMLRGWVAVWSMQMLWLMAGLAATVGATAMVELMWSGHADRVRARALLRVGTGRPAT